MLIVLVHGFNDTYLKFKTMQSAFEKAGHDCIVPSLTPKNAGKGLEHLARQLNDIINAGVGDNNAKICLVGFSMGGLISRYYLQELGGYKRVSRFFSISAPHHGTHLAYLSMSLGARQMRPDSEFIRLLEQNADRLGELECYSYWTPFDLMILPATSSKWGKAENISVNSLCHPCMVNSRRVITDMIARIESL